MEFPGFQPEDFEVFAIPDFAGRMGALRARIRPKLLSLGEDLSEAIAEICGVPTFPHAAQHMRRRVNPPEETWAAFTRDRKGYKRWTHYRVAVSGRGARVTVFVEDDADDKPRFGERLERDASSLLSSLRAAPLVWYTLGSEPTPNGAVTPAALQELGRFLQGVRAAKFQAGIPIDRERAAAMGPGEFEQWALAQVRLLKPLYLAGAA